MNNKFDELTMALAQSAPRRQALRRFGVGLAGVALTMLGLAAVFAVVEPASASAKVVTSGDVRLVSERMKTDPIPSQARGRNGKYARTGYSNRI